VVNASISGETTAGGAARIDGELKRVHPKVVVIALGANDGLRGLPLAQTKANLEKMIRASKQSGAKVLLVGMQMPPNMGAEYTAAFEKIFPELAKANNAALIPFLLEGVGGKPDLNLPDLIHPTAEGQKIVANNVWAALKPVLESASFKKPNGNSDSSATRPTPTP
jgi:acyl-CoA thioesterase-1